MNESNKVKIAQILGTVVAIVGTGVITYKVAFHKGAQVGVNAIRNILIANDKNLFRKVTELIRSTPDCGIKVIKRG